MINKIESSNIKVPFTKDNQINGTFIYNDVYFQRKVKRFCLWLGLLVEIVKESRDTLQCFFTLFFDVDDKFNLYFNYSSQVLYRLQNR